MAKTIFNVLFKALISIANILLYPINTAISGLIPSVASAISIFSQSVNYFLTTKLGYFAYMIPPRTKSMILLYITFMIGFYTISWGLHATIWLLKVVKKLPMA